jgi:hypothetical protein
MGEVLEMKKGEVDLHVKVEEGKVKLSVVYGGAGADASVSVDLKAEYFVKKLTDAIPGEIDDQLAAMLLALLNK